MICFKKGFLQLLIVCFCYMFITPLIVNANADGPVDLKGNFLGNRSFDKKDSLSYKTSDEVYQENLNLTESHNQIAAQSLEIDNTTIFAPYISIDVGSWPEAVAIGDVNNDGKNDVVLTTSSYSDPGNDYHIFVFLQNISGTLSSPVKYPAGNGESADIADLNNDGRKDVVVTSSNAIGVFLQNESGSLNPLIYYPSNHSSGSNTHKVKTGDFNNDGLTDVVSIDWGTQSHNVDVYLQNNIGTLDAPVTYVVMHGGYDDLEVGDVNNDGLTDIVVMSGQSYSYDNLGILLQNSSGLFDMPVYYDLGIDKNTSGVAVGDINDDSLQDVVVTYGGNRPSSFIAAFNQNNFNTLDAPVNYASYDIPESVEIADVNHDGVKDVIVLHGGWMQMGVYFQGLDGTLDSEVLFPIPYASHYNPHGLAVGDLNGDGSNDIAIADYNQGLVILYSTASVFERPVADAGPDIIEYDNVTLDASRSHDPDGYIVSYNWEITRMDNPADTQTANGEFVSLTALSQGFYDVTLTVTDDQGLSDLDAIMLAVKGPEPQCEYTLEDVQAAYNTGHADGKSENQAGYDMISGELTIPAVLVDGNILPWTMKRKRHSSNFKLIQGFESIKNQ